VLNVLAGYDPEDPDAKPHAPVDYLQGIGNGIRGLRLGVPERYIESVPVEPEVRAAFDAALADLSRLGAEMQVVDLDVLGHARAANFVVLNAEHYASHASLLQSQWTLHGRSARLYLTQAAFLSATDYLRGKDAGRLIAGMVDAVFDKVDVLVTPTSPVITAEAARQPDAHRRGVNASFTAPFNITGHPAFSVPCGMSAVGLPIGLQVVGRKYDEPILLRVAYAYEQATPWHTLRPPLQAAG
jgi:aspartyl-tRNA(Asn)/glutamyl-tRNA(Gln) amidotransferase subunit A